MNEHLTPAQFDALLIGDTNPSALPLTAQEHLSTCATCTAEFANTRSLLGHLSEALTGMAREQPFRRNTPATLLNFRSAAAKRPVRRFTATFALAASFALAAAILPFTHMAAPPATKAPISTPASTVQSDEALLNDIDQQLSASVPQALALLEDPTKEK